MYPVESQAKPSGQPEASSRRVTKHEASSQLETKTTHVTTNVNVNHESVSAGDKDTSNVNFTASGRTPMLEKALCFHTGSSCWQRFVQFPFYMASNCVFLLAMAVYLSWAVLV